MQRDLCGDATLCEAMDPIDGELLKNYLLKVNFTGLLLTFIFFILNILMFPYTVLLLVSGNSRTFYFEVNKGKDTSRKGIQ